MKNFKYLFLILSTIFIFEMFNSNKAEACTISSGVVSESDIDNGCDTAPAEYEIVIYKLYLCTGAPTEATTSSTVVLTPCSQVFENSTGATAAVTQGAEIVLDGTYTPVSYTHLTLPTSR